MPLPLGLLAAAWAIKTGGTYLGYKKLKEKKPELVEEWEAKAKRFKGQATDYIFGKDGQDVSAPPQANDENDEGGSPPAP